MHVGNRRCGLESVFKEHMYLKSLRLRKVYNDDEAAIGYDYYLARHGEGVLDVPDRRGLHFVIEEKAKTNAKAAGQTPETLRLTESSVLDEIKKSGFVERIRK
jgi:hypothetical protein